MDFKEFFLNGLMLSLYGMNKFKSNEKSHYICI